MVLNDINGSPCKVYSLTWSEFGSSLTSAVRNLRNLEDLTDVTVSAGGKIFPAHKLILSAASPLLMELLKNAKCQHPILMLAGISSSDFETILDFVYQGEVNIDYEKLPSLLQAAQLLDIQALSPNALVMNSPASTCNNEDISLAYSDATPNNSSITSSEVSSKEPESPCASLKRKRASRSVETSKVSSVDACKKSCPTGDAENSLVTQPPPKSILPAKVDEVNGQEDEKKIISDLPVNCKLCGVTIRQSRNLRRHIDHMHLKQKLRSKSKEAKDQESEGKSVLNTFKVAFTKKIDDLNNNPSTSTVLNFSEDSFTQLTEEIFSCSAASTLSSGEGSFSPSNIQMTSSTCSSAAESLARPSEGESCAPVLSSCSRNAEQVKSSANEQCSSVKTYECNSLEDSCNMNDIALKELETQLFSVCFCSAEGEDASKMVLVIDGVIPEEHPPDSHTLFLKYPSLKDTNQQFLAIQPKIIGGACLLYVRQREMAVTMSYDKSINILGSDDATTCVVIILRHTGSGAVGLAHLDGNYTEECIVSMVHKVQHLSLGVQGRLELHLVGGLSDERHLSEELFFAIMHAVHKQSVEIDLKLACVGEYNTIVRNNVRWPIFYGAGVNVKTGEIFPANFTDKGPERPLRIARKLTGGQQVLDIYDYSTGFLKIGPFNYEPLRGVDLWLGQSDEFILQHLSTTPDVEPPHFVSEVRAALKYIQDNPFPAVTVFRDNKPHYFRKDENTGLWIPLRFEPTNLFT